MDEINPQTQKTDMFIFCQGTDRERNTLRLRTSLGLLIKPFLDLLLGRQSSWITVGKPDELCITLPAGFCFGMHLGFFECKADKFSAKQIFHHCLLFRSGYPSISLRASLIPPFVT